MNNKEKVFPLFVLALGLLYLVPHFFRSYNSGENGFDFDAYAALPVQDGGRFKPMDTVARMDLMLLSGKQTLVDDKGDRQPAIKWLLDVMSLDFTGDDPAVWRYKFFRIDNDQVLSLLGLEPRSGFRYSLNEFKKKIPDLMTQAKRVGDADAKNPGLFDTKIMELYNQLRLFNVLAKNDAPHVVISPGDDKEVWYSLADILPPNAPAQQLEAMPTGLFHYYLLKTYAENKPAQFNQIVAKAKQIIDPDLPKGASRTGFEVFYNRVEPFHYASEFYAYALVLGLLSWLGWSKPLHQSAVILMVMALGLSTFGLVSRWVIMDRFLVNVTNLYSSAVFIGWGCAFFCLIMEFIIPKGFALVAGSAVAGLTGIIAHNLSLDGDTMKMMEAVLDTNFWLATHVTCITLGYTATFLAGFLGIVYITLGVFTPQLRHGAATMLAKMIYGVVCFATLLSFTGTVLGGIWADQSWGRFWGWDPKENGALLIVIWNALVLHARWGGIVKQRGMAQLVIGGNIVTSWSWFGTNMLGVGLHSYGFMPAALAWLLVFAASQLFLISLGWIPMENWLSFQKASGPPAPPPNGNGPLPQRIPLPRTAITTSS
jgi:ABC-type transport system involved in cytochrome c biogenesis permease subunit